MTKRLNLSRILSPQFAAKPGAWVEEHSGWSLAGFCFPISRCPLRFDLDDSDFS
jgi:hypothetical protein